ncbi:MAG: hypothetical protein RR424_05720 [Oscillospiraceae bacterium]
MGAQISQAIIVLGSAVLYIGLVGRFITKKLKCRNAVFTQSVIYGTAVFVLCTIIASITGKAFIIVSVLLMLCIWQLVSEILSIKKRKSIKVSNDAILLCALCAAMVIIYSLACGVYAHPSAVGSIVPNQDFFWNVGNAQSFLRGFPPQDMRFSGVTLRYHYLTELIAAGLSMMTSVSSYNMIAFYLTPIILTALVLMLWDCGKVVFNAQRSKQWLFIAAILFMGCLSLHKSFTKVSVFGNTYIIHLLTNINGMATATILLAAFITIFCLLCRDGFRQKALFSAGILSFFLLCFAKGPIAGVVAIAVVLSLALLCITNRRDIWAKIIFALIIGGGFALLYATFFSGGADTSIAFNLTGTLSKTYFKNYFALFMAKGAIYGYLALPILILCTIFCIQPAVMTVYAAGLYGDIKNIARLQGERVLANAVVIGGLLGFFLFDHGSFSQVYFLFAALFFAAMLAVDNIDKLLVQINKRRKALRILCKGILASFALLSVITAIFTYAYCINKGILAVNSEKNRTSYTSLTAKDEEGMQMLNALLPQDKLFITNRIHSGAAQEGLSNVYSALSQRQSYMESFKYAVSNMGVPKDEVSARLDVVNNIFGGKLSANEIKALCKEHNIGAIVYSENAAGDFEKPCDMTADFENEDISIYLI